MKALVGSAGRMSGRVYEHLRGATGCHKVRNHDDEQKAAGELLEAFSGAARCMSGYLEEVPEAYYVLDVLSRMLSLSVHMDC